MGLAFTGLSQPTAGWENISVLVTVGFTALVLIWKDISCCYVWHHSSRVNIERKFGGRVCGAEEARYIWAVVVRYGLAWPTPCFDHVTYAMITVIHGSNPGFSQNILYHF